MYIVILTGKVLNGLSPCNTTKIVFQYYLGLQLEFLELLIQSFPIPRHKLKDDSQYWDTFCPGKILD